MINVLHLLWIIPISGMVGYFMAAMCWMASKADYKQPRP